MGGQEEAFDRRILLELIEKFEVLYIIPVETFATSERKELLNRAGIAQQMKGNMMPVVVDPVIVAALRRAPADVTQKLHAAGWGIQGADTLRNPNSESGYTEFIIQELEKILAQGRIAQGSPGHLTAEGQKYATQVLFVFASKITQGLILK